MPEGTNRISVIGGTPQVVFGHTPHIQTFFPGGDPPIEDVLPQFGTPVVTLLPVQVAGLLPLYPCDTAECREICDNPWRNLVFGELIGSSYQPKQTYENDWSSFMIDISMINAPNGAVVIPVTIDMYLEKYYNGQWRRNPFAPDLNSAFGIYGVHYGIGDVKGHPSYVGYDINWGAVIASFGPGCYRFKIDVSYQTKAIEVQPHVYVGVNYTYRACLQSPTFDARIWDCMAAHGTVKFETWLTGLIGDPYTDYKMHDYCGVLKYDSIRIPGFFGYEKSPTYLKNNLKWGSPQNGKIEKVSDEQTQRWEYLSKYLPEYIHSRFATFGMMSDRLFVSDYNINNSNYTYKRKNVIYDSGYEPEYIDKEAFWTRRHKAKVQVFFNRGVQSVIKSLCCPVVSDPTIGT